MNDYVKKLIIAKNSIAPIITENTQTKQPGIYLFERTDENGVTFSTAVKQRTFFSGSLAIGTDTNALTFQCESENSRVTKIRTGGRSASLNIVLWRSWTNGNSTGFWNRCDKANRPTMSLMEAKQMESRTSKRAKRPVDIGMAWKSAK